MLIRIQEKEVRTYDSYKKEKTEKSMQRIKSILQGIDDLSLTKSDKEQLLKKIKKSVSDFEPNYSNYF